MNLEHAGSAEIAKRLNISQRQARRLIKDNDPRLYDVDRDHLLRCSRKRLAEECARQADAVGVAAAILAQAPTSETLNEGPEIERLNAIVKKLRKTASEIRVLASAFLP